MVSKIEGRWRVALIAGVVTLSASSVSAPLVPGADIDSLIARELPKLVEIRRQLHAHPELSNREFETAKLIAGYLRSIGLEPREGLAKTGVVALIGGAKPGPCVMLRADIDALPIDEKNDMAYRSLNPGIKHACGHDLHMAVLLGAAKVLAQMRNELHGSVKLVFQPAEEGPPAGEEGGASLMVKEGVLDDPPVAVAFALHDDPDYKTGILTVRPGSDMAEADTFDITVTGQRAHGAFPHRGVDPIPVAAQIVLQFQSLITRTQDATKPAVLSIGIIEGGNRFNIVAGSVRLSGTVRTLDAAQREDIKVRMEKIVSSACGAFGATYTFAFTTAAPMVVNDPNLAAFAKKTFVKYFGPDHVIESPPHMVAEDFSHFASRVRAVYFHLGVRNESKGLTHALHTELFDADDEAIPIGVKAMSALALDYLAK